MLDSEKPLKVFSGIVSGLLVVSALVFFLFASREPKQAEAVLEYSAAPGFDPAELASELDQLLKNPGFLGLVAVRSKCLEISDPELVSMLRSRLSFEADRKDSIVSIRFTHRNSATAIDVANAAATVAKETLENLQQKLATEILVQEDAIEDKRKLLASVLKREADAASGQRNEEDDWRCRIGHQSPVDAKADHEHAVRKLEELRAKPVFSIGSLRAAKLRGD